MTISGISADQSERAILVLKKQQDVAKETGAALVDLIKAPPPNANGSLINVYA